MWCNIYKSFGLFDSFPQCMNYVQLYMCLCRKCTQCNGNSCHSFAQNLPIVADCSSNRSHNEIKLFLKEHLLEVHLTL